MTELTNSDYNTHNTQPWDCFMFLDPYCANAIKYLLRVKESFGNYCAIVGICVDVEVESDGAEHYPFKDKFDRIKTLCQESLSQEDVMNDIKKAKTYLLKLVDIINDGKFDVCYFRIRERNKDGLFHFLNSIPSDYPCLSSYMVSVATLLLNPMIVSEEQYLSVLNACIDIIDKAIADD